MRKVKTQRISELRAELIDAYVVIEELHARLAGMIDPKSLTIAATGLWSEENDPEYNRGVLELTQEVLASPLGIDEVMKQLVTSLVVNPGIRQSIINPGPEQSRIRARLRAGLKAME
jgi:hypothetical protein